MLCDQPGALPTRSPTGSSPPAAPPLTGAARNRPVAVFLDPSGQRWRRVRAAGLLLTLPAAAAVALTATGASTVPDTTTPQPALDLTVIDTGVELPVVGSGPLVRVTQIDRTGPDVTLVDAATGQPGRTLTERELRKVKTAGHVVERYGYGATQARTLTLTFDGGPHEEHTPRLLDTLRDNDVPAAFFVTARHAVREPELIRRAAAEGHLVANNSLTYVNLTNAPAPRARQELVITERTLHSMTGQAGGIVRLPFDRGDDTQLGKSVGGLLAAQRLGYTVVSHDAGVQDLLVPTSADTSELPLPTLTGQNLTLRLHDGGGAGRDRTIDYVEDLIEHAKRNGYTFATVPQLDPSLAGVGVPGPTTWKDTSARKWTELALNWTDTTIRGLFLFALTAVVGVSGVTVCLALRRARRRKQQLAAHAARTAQSPQELSPLSVTVLLAAFNEHKVIARTLASLTASRYPLTELVVVDDGSTDGTAEQVRELARTDCRIRLVQQANTGKAGALNHGLRVATGEIIVTVDADTLVSPDTVGNLVRHFEMDTTGQLGAVAGVVRVGNRRLNLITRWQALEYLTQISVDRAAHDSLGAITIVPGSCAAWRRTAIVSSGGYSHDTLAEDCDLSLSLHRAGWKLTQDDEALAFTEAPATVDDLLKQRIRWTFGTMQAVAKHHQMLLRPRYGWLGMVVLPWYVLSLVVPLLTIPFIAVMALIAVRTQGWGVVAVYFAAFTLAHLIVAACGVKLAGESRRLLLTVPLYRLVYEPLRAYLLYAAAYSALRGLKVSWNKLDRAGSVQQPPDPTGTPAVAAPAAADRPLVIDLRDRESVPA